MLDDYGIAEMLGSNRAEGGAHRLESSVIYGTAVEDSEDGYVRVVPNGDVYSDEGDNTITIATGPSVKAGDSVHISLLGGVSKTPMVTAVSGEGDRQDELIKAAQGKADQAAEDASAASDAIAGVQDDIAAFKDGSDVSYAIYNYVDDEVGEVSTKITATYTATAPNLSPYFSHSLDDIYDATSNPNGYWPSSTPKSNYTEVGEGWAHIEKAAGSSSATASFYVRPQSFVKPDTDYTILFEVRNLTFSSGSSFTISFSKTSGSYVPQIPSADQESGTYSASITADGATRFKVKSRAAATLSSANLLTRSFISIPANTSISCDVRVSIYEGEYDGGFKPYKPAEYEVSSLIDQTAESIEFSVSQNYVSNDTLDSTLESYATISSLTIDDTFITSEVTENYAKKEYVADAIADIDIGGKNYVLASSVEKDRTRSSSNVMASYDVSAAFRALPDDVDSFMLSFDAKVENASSLKLDAYLRDSSSVCSTPTQGSYNVTPTTSYARYSKKITRNSDKSNADILYVYIRAYSGTGTFYVKNVKLEIGDKSTDWTPAPEDKAESSLVATHSTQIQQTSTSIESLALGNTTYTDPDGNTVTSSLGTKVSQTESSVTTLIQSAITGETVEYAVGTSATTAPTTGWSASTPAWEAGKYVWQRTGVTVNGNTTYSSPVCIQGAKGETGAMGAGGAIKCTCSTAAGTAEKVVTCSESLTLEDGLVIEVAFSTANTASAPTLNLTANSTALGAKSTYVAGTVTGDTNRLRWGAGAVIQFRYDVSLNSSAGGWVPLNVPFPLYGTSSTAAGTATKTSTIGGAVICKGTVATIKFSNALTNTGNTTLNISSSGAHTIYARNATVKASSPCAWAANATVTFSFDGKYWRMNEDTLATMTSTMIRQYSQGVLVCKTGNTVGALVNADGSFDVVAVTWTDGEPTAGTVLGRFAGKNIYLGVEPTGPVEANLATMVSMNGGLFTIQSSLTEPETSGGTDYTAALTVMRAASNLLDNWQMTLMDKAFLSMSEYGYGYDAKLRVDGVGMPMVAGVEAVSSKTDNSGYLTLLGDNIQLESGTTRTSDSTYEQTITRYYTSNGFTIENAVFKASADMVVMPIQFSATSNAEFAATKVATIPSDYAPTEAVRFVVWCAPDWSSSNFKCGYGQVDTSGNVTLTCPSAKYWMGQAVWIRNRAPKYAHQSTV